MILKSNYPDVAIPDVSLTQFLLKKMGSFGDSPALVDGLSGATITYPELVNAIKSAAGGLQAHGFNKGDVLGIMLPNIPEYAIAFHGAAWAGGAASTINPTYTAGEVRHQLSDSGAKFVVTITMFLETATEAAKGTAVEEIYVFDASDDAPAAAELFGGPPLAEQVPVDPAQDVVVLPYSSGTTGRSKGVMLTHRNCVANLVQTQESSVQFSTDDAFVAVLPFFHIYGMQVLMNMGLAAGSKLITMPRFDLEHFLKLNQDHKCAWAFVVPPMVLALAQHPTVDDYDLSSLHTIFSAAAPLGGKISAMTTERIGAQVAQGYGMTETSPVSHASPMNAADKPGSVGTLVSTTECRIVDEDSGEDVPVGESGEIWIRGPQVMKGYINNEAATKAMISDDGWLRTGDIGLSDEDGYYWIVDRLKELIKYKGFQVPPAELEALLITHDEIIDVAVIGVPDDAAGELPKAFVVRRPGAELTAEDVQGFVAGQVATYKQIRMVEFINEIPKSPSGKILRRFLRDN